MTELKSNIPKCNYCGRPATYRRRTSGELFCPRCFIQGFLRRLHRTIARYSMLSPYSTILVPILPDKPYTSLALSVAITMLEEKYPSSIGFVIPLDTQWGRNVLKFINSKASEKALYYGLSYAKYYARASSFSSRYCLSRAIAVVLAEKTGYNNVLLPYSLDDLAVLYLSSMLKGDLNLGTDIVAVKVFGKVIMGYPLYDTPWEDIVYFNYISNVYDLNLDYKEYHRMSTHERYALEMYLDLIRDSRELGYNILKNPRLLTPIIKANECPDTPCPRSNSFDYCRLASTVIEEIRGIKLEILSP